MNREQAKAFRAKIERASAWTDDADALTLVELFPKWQIGKSVIAGERLQDEGTLYKCIIPHRTQSDWRPKDTPTLWKVVSLEEWPEWKQPTGSADAYMKGDKVSHNDRHWISDADSNVWEPGVYGWHEA